MRVRDVAVGAAWVVVIGSAAGGPAGAAASFGIPAPGTVVGLGEHARGVEVACGDSHVRFDLDGRGTIKIGQSHTEAGHPVVDLVTQTEHLHGSGRRVGAVAVTETVPVTGKLTEHSTDQPFPAHEDIPMRLRFTFEHDPCAAAAAGAGASAAGQPVVLEAQGTAQFTAALRQFPPPAQGTDPDGSPTGGTLYHLNAPVSLRRISSPERKPEFAQLQGMNIKVGQLRA